MVGIYKMKTVNGDYPPVLSAYEKILSYNHIPFVRLEASQTDFWDKVKQLDLFILRWSQVDSDRQIAHDLLPVIEGKLGIKCYPDQNTCWHYDDKIKQYLLLKPLGYPMVESYIFWDRKKALAWADRADYPVVFKLRGGAGSQNVILVKNCGQARKLVKRMFGPGIYPEKFVNLNSVRFKYFSLYRELHHLAGNIYRRGKGLDASPFWQVHKNYALFQKFLLNNTFDTRITIIGDRAFAFRRITRKNDFRASGSGMIDYDLSQVDIRCVKIAFEVSQALKFQSMAYDFLFDPDNQPQFCEVSYTFLSRAIYNCSGYFDRNLSWHEGHYWPEHLHLIDALGLPDLKAPEMDY